MIHLVRRVCRAGAVILTLSCWHLVTLSSCYAGPVSDTPYKLTVVLDVAKNRVLTDIFRQQVERELQEGLQAALGDLARVNVRSDHPKLEEIRKKGLKQVLDGWNEVSDEKTHFVLIDLVDNQYKIQARQHDGPTGTSSPVVRTDVTSDRAYVARAAALLIEQDFGFTATFTSWPRDTDTQPQIVRLDLEGAGFGVPMSRWVKQNDVFAVVQMFSDRNPDEVPWALLQIKDPPGDGSPENACTGRLFWRYKPPPPAEGANHRGYRCVKLGAIRTPLRLRIVQKKGEKSAIQAAPEFAVSVSRHGFQRDEPGLVKGMTEHGYFTTAARANVEPFDRVAFVTVSSNGRPVALLPVRLVDDQTTVVIVPAIATELADALAQRFERWQRQVVEAYLVQNNTFNDLNELANKPGVTRETILGRAKDGLTRSSDDFIRLSAEKEEILKAVAPLQKSSKQRTDPRRREELRRLEQVLAEMKTGEGKLAHFVEEQDKILKYELSPEVKTAKAQIQDAQLAESRADFARAIELYRKALAVVKDPEREKQLEKLEADWAVKSPEHEQARKFIYETWPKLDTAGLDQEMPNARKALQECQRVADGLSPQKLVLAANIHISRISKELVELDKDDKIDDEKAGARINKILPQLKQLVQDAVEVVKSLGAN